MRIRSGILLLAALPAFAADQDFNGRWDITPITERPRAWWVELSGVGTPQAQGKFVSAYGGDMNTISTITVENGELHFRINPTRNANAKGPAPGASVYRARLTGASWKAPSKWKDRIGRRLSGPVCALPRSTRKTTAHGKRASRSLVQWQGSAGMEGAGSRERR